MANDFKTQQIEAPQVTADPFHADRLFSKQLEVVKEFWKNIVCADDFRAAKWSQGSGENKGLLSGKPHLYSVP